MDRGLFVGRFQPPHQGHIEVVKRLASVHDELIITVGSANVSHTPRNPFTAGERVEMLRGAFKDARVDNVVVLPLPDMGRNVVWVSHVASFVPRFSTVYTNNPLPARLFREAGYRVAPAPFVERERYESTRIRRLMIEGGAWEKLVPDAVVRVVAACDGIGRMRDLAHLDGAVEGSMES